MLTEGVYCSPPSDMMRPRPSTEPRLPHNRSMGRVRFSRLGCPMSSNRWSNGLGYISSFWWCLAYLSNTTSRTYGIFKSSCRHHIRTPLNSHWIANVFCPLLTFSHLNLSPPTYHQRSWLYVDRLTYNACHEPSVTDASNPKKQLY